MYFEGRTMQVDLTREEALALFLRCLNSSECDTPEIVSALRKLGHLLESSEEPHQLLAS
jgi:hypothetical protein